ncbi:MAG: hypothetical protein CMA12_04245 [Euryarchaeota archaeon]|nr:hypothetical protein [Euryarchaeota archaeon]OUW22366.1 MAG: hypothetical protein CBD33_02590 [Euryarchaeota archaeon TMED173]
MSRLISSLEQLSSFVREIESGCVFVGVTEGFLLAGSKAGELWCWSVSSGLQEWKVKFEGPCSKYDFSEGKIVFSESDKIHAVKIDSGEILWSVDLEGSSDFIFYDKKGVWASSSVYNFEIQDYSEGSIWRINNSGEKVLRVPIKGRAWSLDRFQDSALFGLSRPNCGYGIASNDGAIEYFSSDQVDSPVTVGKGDGREVVVLGHSNGTLSVISEHIVQNYEIGKSSVVSIDYLEEWAAALESGVLAVGDRLGSWSIETGNSFQSLCFGPTIEGESGIWTFSWDEKSVIRLLDQLDGTQKIEVFHDAEVGASFGSTDHLCIGDNSGMIYLIEKDVLRRRIIESSDESAEDEGVRNLRKKIRRLRGG